MKNTWRYIDTGFIGEAENMALDMTFLTAVRRGESPNTFRIMNFARPCVLVGRNQNVFDEVNVEACCLRAIPINRRESGGGAILMDSTVLGWEIVAKKAVLPTPSIEEIYALLCGGCAAALRSLGVPANFRPHNDIEVNGRKISGAGGTEMDDTFFFHGSLLVDFDLELMLSVLHTPLEKLKDKGISSMRERMTWLNREVSSPVSNERIFAALATSFSEALGFEYERGRMNDFEKGFFESALPYYRSDEWIYGGRALNEKTDGVFAHKAPGGLMRAGVVADIKRDRLSYVVINGDFFSYPSRLVPDLESDLKNCRISDVEQIIDRFFSSREWHIPGVAPADFKHVVLSALKAAGER